MKKIINLIENARHVYICGNGGSSATAEHLASDLFSKGIKAYCLNSNTSIMTMTANDFGYQFTFSNQLRVYATYEDLLITISASGTSPNIVKAIKMAKHLGMPVLQFETFGKDRDYEGVEDRHMQMVHKIKKHL